MAESLNDILWDERPLILDVPYRSDHTVVEDSDFAESPSMKAARNRRREQIGRRYLLGHIPLIQTASLRGPFGSECGWVAPWRRNKTCPKSPEPQKAARTQYRATMTQGVVHTEIATLAERKFAEVSLDEDALRYDADNEDDIFDEINDVDISHPLNTDSLDDTSGEHTQFLHEKTDLRSVDRGMSENSEDNVQWLIKYNDAKHRESARNSFSQNDRKRKRGEGWLKGVNVLKRSRYEALEHSSPTPVAGVIHSGNIGVQNDPPLPKSDLVTTNRRDISPMEPILNAGNALAAAEAVNVFATLRAASGYQYEILSEEMEEGTGNLLTQQSQSTGPIFDYSTEKQAILAQSTEAQQVDPLGSSLLDLHDDGTRYLNSAPCKWPQRVGFIGSQAQGQDFEVLVHGDSAIRGILDNGSLTEPHLDNKIAINDTTSPLSEESFHYRKTNRRSQKQKISPNSHEEREADNDVEEKDGAAGNREPTEHNVQLMQPLNSFAHHSINHSFPEIGGFQTSSTMRRRRSRQGRQHRGKSPESILAAINEPDGVSSPDPLCEGSGKGRACKFAPGNGLELIPIKPLEDNGVRVDCQHTVVAQATSISPEGKARSQASTFRRLSEEPVLSISGDHMETSSNPSLSVLPQPRHPRIRLSELPAKIDGVDEIALIPEFPCYGGLLTQEESQRASNALGDLPLESQQFDVESRCPLSLNGKSESTRSADCGRETETLSVDVPPRVESELVQEVAQSIQSPWTVARFVSSASPEVVLNSGPHSFTNNGEHRTVQRALHNLPLDIEDTAVLPREVDGFPSRDAENKSGEESLQTFGSFRGNPAQSLNTLSQSYSHFPSTQNLVDAATINPWNSVLKKPSRRKSDKRVSFGVLPFNDVDGAVSGAISKPSEPMGSPPPPAGALRLTQLDDPFHYRLRATRDLEVTEESLTKFMNTPWDKIPPIKLRVKRLSSSPAVVAMADAFIAADQPSHSSNVNIQRTSNDAVFSPALTELAENLIQSCILPASEPRDYKRSPTPDASFSIAPSGKVTAVSIGPSGYDAEDNLHAVIEDMGSFLAGWDVESELKKAKGHMPEKGSSLNAVRKREYLSGVSNR